MNMSAIKALRMGVYRNLTRSLSPPTVFNVIKEFGSTIRVSDCVNSLNVGTADSFTNYVLDKGQGSKYRRHTCTNARKIRDVHVTFVTYMHWVHVEIFTQ